MLKPSKKSKQRPLPESYHIKKGDTVMVISGKDKGKTGVIKRVLRDRGKVLVEGLNLVKKATRPNPFVGLRGGIIEQEAPLFVSKVMLYDAKNNKPSRAKAGEADGKKVRVSKKTGEQFDV